jgi:hypothetical protein
MQKEIQISNEKANFVVMPDQLFIKDILETTDKECIHFFKKLNFMLLIALSNIQNAT